MRTVVKKGYLNVYRNLFFWMMVFPILFAALAVFIGFDQFFTLFHQVLFAGDTTWLFDPRVDYFMHAFLIFFVLYEGICASFYLLSRRTK